MAENFMDLSLQALVGAQAAVIGQRRKVTISAVDYDALIEEVPTDTIVELGQERESGQLTVTIRIADLATQPAQLSEVTIDAVVWQVLSVTKIANYAWSLLLGIPE